jgi:NADH:ubiquinone oxidoreductase subunit E
MIQKVSSKNSNGKIGAVMVLGAGVAGIQASLDLADMGYKVYLVENGPSIGGAMAQLDKTFPTNDCAMCLLSPKLVDTARHPNIEIITNTDLQKVDGSAGNFAVTLNKRPRYIDEEKCTGCGTCMNNCPVRNVPHFEEVDELGKVQLDDEGHQRLRQILDEHEGERSAVISVLQGVNKQYKYLPENVLRHVARALDIPLSRVYNIATFYNAFSLTPKGEHIIHVCLGTACYVKGGTKILEAAQRQLEVEVGGTTKDSKFSLETVSCIGCCGQSPVMTVNEDIYGYVSQNKVSDILARYE